MVDPGVRFGWGRAAPQRGPAAPGVHVGDPPHRALARCREITRQHSSTFYLASRLFAPSAREAATVVYAVCRTGDDAVDTASSPGEARVRLEAWWAGVMRAFAATPDPRAPLEVGLHWVLTRYDLPLQAFEELKRGLEQDLAWEESAAAGRVATLADEDELMAYCYRVAGVVGLLVAPIAGYRGGEATLACAVALGQAMQLTNILRDVGEDLRRGRCYLPATLLERYGVGLDALGRGEVSDGYRRLLEVLASRADALYAEGRKGIPRLRGLSAAAVALAALNYQGILGKLRANGYDNLTQRAHLRSFERLATLPRALFALLEPS
jgi:15-cis-phytoene synthase